MDLAGTRLAEHAHEGALRVAPNDRVIDDDEALAGDDIAQGVELEPDAELANRLRRLDEGAADIGVLHEALGERDPGLLGVADCRVAAGLRHRDHEVGLDRVLAREDASGLDAGGLNAASGDRGIGPGEVDILEEAALRIGLGEALRSQALLVDRDELAGLDLPHE
ncbi:unannotated protein [freshwater metagenome]|uniref:Unannotated protein n=1 Tax=freshwater metagenome TaxID=449393 RepID=A0A6J7KL34_9ZZZZ